MHCSYVNYTAREAPPPASAHYAVIGFSVTRVQQTVGRSNHMNNHNPIRSLRSDATARQT